MNECGICLDTFDFENDWIFLECFHFICKTCFLKLKKSECPYCRNPITIDSHKPRSEYKTSIILPSREDSVIISEKLLAPRGRKRKRKKDRRREEKRDKINKHRHNRSNRWNDLSRYSN